jgi:hypothetical protein
MIARRRGAVARKSNATETLLIVQSILSPQAKILANLGDPPQPFGIAEVKFADYLRVDVSELATNL